MGDIFYNLVGIVVDDYFDKVFGDVDQDGFYQELVQDVDVMCID